SLSASCSSIWSWATAPSRRYTLSLQTLFRSHQIDETDLLCEEGVGGVLDQLRFFGQDAQNRHARACKQPLQQEESSDVRCADDRSEEHTSELQSRENVVCRLLLEKTSRVTVV